MNEALTHRGPDSAGEYSDEHVALAMRRLSIIDVEGAAQPLFNEDKSLVLVANGEIYNFLELRDQLTGLGHRFASRGDCETIIHAYEQYGCRCVDHLRGMFAFALWDTNRRRLVLARDRMGEKPLYLYCKDGLLVFASEMRALLRSGLVPFELDPTGVHLYFHFEYVPEPRTAVKGVRKLDAAHLLLVDVDAQSTREQRYWNMEDAAPLDGDPAVLLRAALEDVSRIILRSDVPVGIALSGGLDSSSLAVLAARRSCDGFQAFAVGYPEHSETDERADAAALAAELDMPFHDVEISAGDMVAGFAGLVLARDDPIADIAGYGYYAVARLARDHGVPVLLQGQGGDELFWGYPWVKEAVAANALKANVLKRGWRELPACLRLRGPGGIRPWQIRSWLTDLCGLRAGLRRYHRYRNSDPDRMLFYDLSMQFALALEETPSLYARAFFEQVTESAPFDIFTFEQPWPPIDVRLTSLICDTYLRSNGIAQADRLGMASSIELRLPLLDHKFVETAVGLRKTRPDHHLAPKRRLKEAIGDLLPPQVLGRAKRGFTPPMMEWLSAIMKEHGPDLVDGYLVQSGVLTGEACRRLVAGESLGLGISLALDAVVLELWCRGMRKACP